MIEKERTTATVEEITELAAKLSDNQRGLAYGVMEFMLNYKEFGDTTDNFIDGVVARVKGWFGKKEADTDA